MDAQADLSLRCPHMPKDTFSHDAAHITFWGKCLEMLSCPVSTLIHYRNVWVVNNKFSIRASKLKSGYFADPEYICALLLTMNTTSA